MNRYQALVAAKARHVEASIELHAAEKAVDAAKFTVGFGDVVAKVVAPDTIYLPHCVSHIGLVDLVRALLKGGVIQIAEVIS